MSSFVTWQVSLAQAPAWLREAVRAIAEPPALVDGLAALVAASGRSREHVARTVKACCGCRAGDLVRDLRLDWLARALRLEDTPFADLCEAIGASNVAHLHRHFAKRFGLTPGAYRRRLRRVAWDA